jgi:hypothetical protein
MRLDVWLLVALTGALSACGGALPRGTPAHCSELYGPNARVARMPRALGQRTGWPARARRDVAEAASPTTCPRRQFLRRQDDRRAPG